MHCPFCEDLESRVTDSRMSGEGIRRRRECSRCGLRFTTVERIHTTSLVVIKRDGHREEFDPGKLQIGILKACTKRPVSTEAIERMTDEVERVVHSLGRAEVPTTLIGQLTMGQLRSVDRVAYLRFASVCQDFQDPESFRTEVESLLGEGDSMTPEPGLSTVSLEAQMPLPLQQSDRASSKFTLSKDRKLKKDD